MKTMQGLTSNAARFRNAVALQRGLLITLCGVLSFSAAQSGAALGSGEAARAQQQYLARVKAGEAMPHIIITQKGETTIAKAKGSGDALRASENTREVIEWALTMADITILNKGRYELSATLDIPRSGVALVIGPDATLAAAPDAHLPRMSEQHGIYKALIRNKNRDHVKILNLGTLDGFAGSSSESISCLTFDGRNGGTCGIQGGLIFSAGTILNTWDSFWVVDSKNVRIPLIWVANRCNAPLVMEGCEEGHIGFVAGLQGRKSVENETVDLNSYNEHLRIDTILGWVVGQQRDEVLDINNSPQCTIGQVIGYGAAEQMSLATKSIYSPNGRRLTQKAHIDHNDGTIVKDQRVVDLTHRKVKQWKKRVKTPGFPASLPVINIQASLSVVFKDGSQDQIFQETYKFDLSRNARD